MLIREKLVKAELAAARLHIREVGGNNHGPWVKRFLAETGLPEWYAWCDAFQSYYEHQVAGHRLPIESASVANTWEEAHRRGWTVAKPARGDLGCVNWTQNGPPFGDHVFLVLKARSVGRYWALKTVEGNTSSGAAGSQGDGDGVFIRTRLLAKSQVGFVRIPGRIDDPHARKPVQSVVTTSSSGGSVTTVHTTAPAAKPKPVAKKKAVKKAAPAPRRRYYKLKRNVPLKPGEVVAYQPKIGRYYARKARKKP